MLIPSPFGSGGSNSILLAQGPGNSRKRAGLLSLAFVVFPKKAQNRTKVAASTRGMLQPRRATPEALTQRSWVELGILHL